MRDPEVDCTTLLNGALAFAHRCLQLYGEFAPFGRTMSGSGTTALAMSLGDEPRNEHAPLDSRELVLQLRRGLAIEADRGTIVACALAYDMRFTDPRTRAPTDGIAVELDHRDDYAVTAIVAYRRDADTVELGAMFVEDKPKRVFCARMS